MVKAGHNVAKCMDNAVKKQRICKLTWGGIDRVKAVWSIWLTLRNDWARFASNEQE